MFVCFAPRENPQIAVAVVIQNAGYGAIWAGRIGSLMVEKYLRDTLTSARVKIATEIANTNLMPGYLFRLQFITDSARAALWALQTGDSTRWLRYQDPVQRRLMLDTLHRPVTHITIPFGPRPQAPVQRTDTVKTARTDSTVRRKTDSSGRPARIPVRKPVDSAALKPVDKPVVHNDSSLTTSP